MNVRHRTCVHFTAAGGLCHLGIPVESTRDAELRMACREVNGITGTIACDKREWPPMPVAAALGRMSALLATLEAGQCLVCKEPIESERDVGGVVHAMPCRHVIRSRSEDER